MNFNEIKSKLSKYTVGIAGCGGLGSNCAVSLARVGIGKLVIADFDVIEESNLNRQYFFYDQIGKEKVFALKENILKINPNISVEAIKVKLNPEEIIKYYKNCDIIVEAFDKAEMKEMIVETVLQNFPDKYLICGVGLAGYGKNELIKTEKFGKLIIVGDRENESNENNPPLAPRVCAVSNLMANVVLEILLGEEYENKS
ncbi:MAG: sulfur carrier protein ThiS adenylyltransferase ThiF [Melioribacteraceae bacterium]|nr:sulfur carrier protein ThiS adenylyltransferase ThiF [Melioribacteraceae bacterium]